MKRCRLRRYACAKLRNAWGLSRPGWIDIRQENKPLIWPAIDFRIDADVAAVCILLRPSERLIRIRHSAQPVRFLRPERSERRLGVVSLRPEDDLIRRRVDNPPRFEFDRKLDLHASTFAEKHSEPSSC